MLIPAGSLAPPKSSYAVKGLLTKTMSFARLSINGSYGTYSVVPATAASAACRLQPPGSPGGNGRPSVSDVPCWRAPVAAATALPDGLARSVAEPDAEFTRACLTGNAVAPSDAGRSLGNRWFAGAAIDHTFPLSSTLVGADIFAERLIGLSSLVDWTAEVGVRRQWCHILSSTRASRAISPAPSTAMTIGATYAYAAGRR